MAHDNSAYNHPPVTSDYDSNMSDPGVPQVPATPEYELREEGYTEEKEQSVDLDVSSQIEKMDEDEEAGLEMEEDEESIMDDMSDIPAQVIKKKAAGVNGEGDVYFGREASVDLDS